MAEAIDATTFDSEPQDPRTAPESDDRFSFVEVSSYGPKSKLVKAMAEAHKSGKPLALYEIMQGQVSHGRSNPSPPRIYFYLWDGRKIEFDGKNIPHNTGNPEDAVLEIEFVNYGPGMSPEDTVIDMHDDQGLERTLGSHGHGTSISLAYLESIGVHIRVISNYEGRPWVGLTSLGSTTSGKTTVLNVIGNWTDDPDAQDDPARLSTEFLLQCPPRELVDMMSGIPDMFLFANPKYPGAVLVEPDESAKELSLYTKNIDKGTVTCIDGVVDETPGGYAFLYIDGLKVSSYGGWPLALPWDIQNLAKPDDGHFRVDRSSDSCYAEGNFDTVIASVVSTMSDKRLLSKIVKTAVDHSEDFLELRVRGKFDPLTAQLVRDIWEQQYDGALISSEKFSEAEVGGKKVMTVSSHLFNFLTKAGIKTLLSEKGATLGTTVRSAGELRLSYANDPDALDKIIDKLPLTGAEVDVVEVKGKQFLRIKLAGGLASREDIVGATESNTGKYLRIISAVAHAQKVKLEAFSVGSDKHRKIFITVKTRYEGSFDHDVVVEEYPVGHFEDFAGYDADCTYILLSGDQINTFENPTRLQLLYERFLTSLSKFKLAIAAVPSMVRRKGTGIKRSAPEERFEVVQVTVDQIPATSKDFDAIRSAREDEDRYFVTIGEHFSGNGYIDRVGTRLAFQGNRLEWMSDCRWCQMPVPNKRKGALQMIAKDVVGERRLPVRAGHKITGYKAEPDSADIEFFMDIRNGAWRVVGSADSLEIFTTPDSNHIANNRVPTAEEFENPLVAREDRLTQPWQEFLDNVKGNGHLSKKAVAALVARQWHDQFSCKPSIEVRGLSKSDCVVQLINTCAGGHMDYSTGLAMLLRAVGLPSRVNTGLGNNEVARCVDRSSCVDYFDGSRWRALAEMGGLNFDSSDIPRVVGDQFVATPRIVNKPKVKYKESVFKNRPGGLRSRISLTPITVKRIVRAAVAACALYTIGQTPFCNGGDHSTEPEHDISTVPSEGRDGLCEILCK